MILAALHPITKEVQKEIKHIMGMLPKGVIITPNGVAIHAPGVDHYGRIKNAYMENGWAGFLAYILPYFKDGKEKERIQTELNRLLNEANNTTTEEKGPVQDNSN